MTKQKGRFKPGWPMIIIMLLLGIVTIIFLQHDAFMYQEPIAVVEHTQTVKKVAQKDEFYNRDVETTQKISARILNGAHKGERITLSNAYSKSQAMDREYFKGNQVFVTLHTLKGKQTATIKDVKRDVSIGMMLWLVVAVVLVMMQLTGALAILSVAVNGVLFTLAVIWNQHNQGAGVVWVFAGLAVVFAALTLLIVIGFNRQMLMTFLATILGTGVAMLIAVTVFAVTHEKGMVYESMQYVTQLPRPLFLAETLLGSLGAVMDVATDMIASLRQLKIERLAISRGQLFKSGNQIGRSIMGPLVNVLFFIFVADTIPLALLFLENGNSWGYTFSMNMSLGVTQSLISGIGIVLTVPLASLLASQWLGGARQ